MVAMEAETPEQAITRMNSNLYPTTTIITSAGQPELVILCPLTLKEFLVEKQVIRLTNRLATVDLGIPAVPLEMEMPDSDIDSIFLGGNEEAAQEIQKIVVGTTEKEVEAVNVSQISTGNAPPSDIDSLFNSPPTMGTADADLSLAGLEVECTGLSASEAIDVDRLDSQNARKKEIVHVILQEMIKGEHGPDLPGDVGVLLDEELRSYGIQLTDNIRALQERARFSSKVMVVARARMCW